MPKAFHINDAFLQLSIHFSPANDNTENIAWQIVKRQNLSSASAVSFKEILIEIKVVKAIGR